jgi:hypothetical protein
VNPCALSGTVRAGGVAVSGATVVLVAAAPDAMIASQQTDANGRYSFSAAWNVSFSGALVSVVSPTYTIETRYVPVYRDETADFDLAPLEQVDLNASVRRTVGDDRCAGLGYGGFGGTPCRRLNVNVPAPGILRVSLIPAPGAAFDVAVLRPDGTVGVESSSRGAPLTVRVGVDGGRPYQIDVVAREAVREFDLTTVLE